MSTPLASLGNRTPEQLKVAELREELKKRGIAFKGLKKDLVDRLEEVLRQEELEQKTVEKEAEAVAEESVPADDAAVDPDPRTPVTKEVSKDDEVDTIEVSVENVQVETVDVIVDTAPEGNGEAEIAVAVSLMEDEPKAEPPSEPVSNALQGTGTEPVNAESGTAMETVTDVPDDTAVQSLASAPVEEPAAQSGPVVEEEELPMKQVEADAEMVVEEELPVNPVESVLAVEGAVDAMEGSQEKIVEEHAVSVTVEEQILTSTTEETVTTTVEEQTVTTTIEEQTVTTLVQEESAVMVEDKSDAALEVATKEGLPEFITDKSAVEEEVKTKDVNSMDIDGDGYTGSKRKEAVDAEIRGQEPAKRRRWNTGKGEIDLKAPTRTDAVKEVPAVDLKDGVPSSNNAVPMTRMSISPKSNPLPEKVASTRPTLPKTEVSVNGEDRKTRVVPPSAKPATTSLKIDRFLRPFTFKAVKELLAQTGTVENVWMDQIKTHCYVTYSSVEEATATRNALYNVQWPPQGGRLLTAEFVDPMEVKVRCDADKGAVATAATTSTTPTTNAITPRVPVTPSSKGQSESGLRVAPPIQPPSSATASLPPPPPLPFPPRDRPKQVAEVEKTPTLDDLFKKTRAKPHIYYLPLTAEEIAVKVTARNRAPPVKPGVKA